MALAHRFNYRAVAVVVTPTHVLLHRLVNDNFWSLPGGHVEMGEFAAETLRREMVEEIGEAAQVGRLLWVSENLFTHNGRRFHEVGLYFLARFAKNSPLYQKEGFMGLEVYEPEVGPALKLEFRWFPREEGVLRALPVLPQFLPGGLVKLPRHPVHFIHADE